jgi:hypothetical protein
MKIKVYEFQPFEIKTDRAISEIGAVSLRGLTNPRQYPICLTETCIEPKEAVRLAKWLIRAAKFCRQKAKSSHAR